MANISFHKHMKNRYGLRLNRMEENYLEKGFDAAALSCIGEDYRSYFEQGNEVHVCLLFVDVCNFSTRYGDSSGEQIGHFFQRYYDRIMPIVFKYNGVIEKVIGDGMVILFGPPFLEIPPLQCFPYADMCAKEILLATNGTEFSSKIAFHSGKVRYFRNSSGYEDFTIIGKPLTELFRIEGISVEESINYFGGGIVKIYYDDVGLQRCPDISAGRWVEYYSSITPQKGTEYNALYYIQNIK